MDPGFLKVWSDDCCFYYEVAKGLLARAIYDLSKVMDLEYFLLQYTISRTCLK